MTDKQIKRTNITQRLNSLVLALPHIKLSKDDGEIVGTLVARYANAKTHADISRDDESILNSIIMKYDVRLVRAMTYASTAVKIHANKRNPETRQIIPFVRSEAKLPSKRDLHRQDSGYTPR